ncbi:methyltransferase [Streptomyces sp. NPDC001700]
MHARSSLGPVSALLDVYQQAMLFHGICAVSRLGIPDLLADGPRTVPELATAVDGDEGALRRVLILLACHGVLDLDREADRAALTELGEVLCRRHPYALGATFATFGVPDVAHALTETIRTGAPATTAAVGTGFWEHLARHPEQQTLFGDAMAEQARLLTLPCVPLLDWPSSGTVADIAGGGGMLLAHILDEQPGLSGVLVDRPQVLEQALSALKDAGVDGRCTVHEGDLLDPPPPADMYVLSRVLHNWDDAGVVRILAALARGARAGAVLRVFEDVLPGDRLPTAPQAWADLAMLMFYEGARERTAGEFRALLAAGGWRLERVVQGPPGMCVMEAGRAP